MTDPVPVLRLDGLGRDFTVRAGGRRALLRAVHDVSLSLERGRVTSIVGESGSGKTTLARMVIGLEKPTRGRILLNGTDLASLRGARRRTAGRQIQAVFQDPHDSLSPRLRVGAIVMEPLRAAGLSRAQSRARMAEVLNEVGLPAAAADGRPHEFSGGQRQRISIARAIGPRPAVAVLDEPTSALDVSVQASILSLLRRLQEEERITFLFISHNLAVVRHLSDKVAVMYLGQLVEIGSAEQLFARPSHPYTRALLSAVPSPDPTAKRERIRLQGDLPSPLEQLHGCPFASRCPNRQPTRCDDEVPSLRVLSPGHQVACHWAEDLYPSVPIATKG